MTELFDIQKLGSIKDLSNNREISAKELLSEIGKRQKTLLLNNFKPRDVVALLNNNTIDFFIDFFSILNLNGIPFPIAAGLKNQGLIFDSVGVRFFITADNNLQEYRHFSDSGVSADCALLLLSSGTNGRSKAVCISKKLLSDRIRNIQKMQSDTIGIGLCMLQTSFGHGLIANCLSLLVQQKRLVLLKDFDLSLCFKLHQIIINEGVDFLSTVPAHFEFLRKSGLQKLGSQSNTFELHCASAFLKAKTYSYMRKISGDAKIKYHYGMTEMGSWMTQLELPVDANEFKYGHVGKGFGLDFICEKSEIFINSCMSEVRTIDIQTAKQNITPEGSNFNTGDLGLLDNGNLVLSGRNGDFINKAGYKISPYEIEDIIAKHELVEECTVFAVEDSVLGEQIATLIVTKQNDTEAESAIKKFCFENLATLYFPKYFYFTTLVEQHNNGKVSRKTLSDFYSKRILENL